MSTTELQKFADELWLRLETTDGKWRCGKDSDRLFYANQLANEKGTTLKKILNGQHVCCDCEIAFNYGSDE